MISVFVMKKPLAYKEPLGEEDPYGDEFLGDKNSFEIKTLLLIFSENPPTPPPFGDKGIFNYEELFTGDCWSPLARTKLYTVFHAFMLL